MFVTYLINGQKHTNKMFKPLLQLFRFRIIIAEFTKIKLANIQVMVYL
jgi:hypothetical protein